MRRLLCSSLSFLITISLSCTRQGENTSAKKPAIEDKPADSPNETPVGIVPNSVQPGDHGPSVAAGVPNNPLGQTAHTQGPAGDKLPSLPESTGVSPNPIGQTAHNQGPTADKLPALPESPNVSSGTLPPHPLLSPSTNNPAGVIPGASDPPGVVPTTTPIQPVEPPGVVPSEGPTEPPGIIPPRSDKNLLFPAACVTNMEHGNHVTDFGFIARLTDKGGKLLAAAHMDASALARGHVCSTKSMYACFVLDIPLAFQALTASSAGEGLLSLCMAEDVTKTPDATICKKLPEKASSNSLGIPDRRKFQYLDLPVKFKADAKTIEITEYSGMPGDPNGENELLVFHPALAFAAPGACELDLQSPLVLDLDDNGHLDLTEVWGSQAPVMFDWRGDGVKTRTGWVKPSDGFLVLDHTNSYLKTDGSILFGEYSAKRGSLTQKGRAFANGFDALAQYDDDHNGRIDAADPIFKRLRIWRDKNQNGVIDVGELSDLNDAKIIAIEVSYERAKVESHGTVGGNKVLLVARYVKIDGTRHLIGDVWFNQRRGREYSK